MNISREARELLAYEYMNSRNEGPYPTYADLALSGNGSFTLCSLRAIDKVIQRAKPLEEAIILLDRVVTEVGRSITPELRSEIDNILSKTMYSGE
jgi:hypothetical protein